MIADLMVGARSNFKLKKTSIAEAIRLLALWIQYPLRSPPIAIGSSTGIILFVISSTLRTRSEFLFDLNFVYMF